MIYDKIENALRYKGTNPYLDEALEFIAHEDLNKLPLGKTVINGDKVFVTIMVVDAVKEEDDVYEYHKNYMDIQLDLEGVEKLLVGFDKGIVATPYTTDIGTNHCDLAATCILGPGRFVICEQEEFHKPSLDAGIGLRLKKAVFKVAVVTTNA